MHALVATVLLRLAQGNALWPNAELDPPDTKGCQPAQCPQRERNAVIGANCRGQSVLPKHRLTGTPHPCLGRMRHAFASKQVATVVIAQREGIAPLMVAQPELTLEIRAPDLVNALAMRQGSIEGWNRDAAATRSHQSVTGQHIAHRADRWPVLLRILRSPHAAQLAWQPGYPQRYGHQAHARSAALPVADQPVRPRPPTDSDPTICSHFCD